MIPKLPPLTFLAEDGDTSDSRDGLMSDVDSTSTETSSDDGRSEIISQDDVQGMSPRAAGQHIFFKHRKT